MVTNSTDSLVRIVSPLNASQTVVESVILTPSDDGRRNGLSIIPAYEQSRLERLQRRYILSQYSNRCNWLKNERFLKDLEGDSVDTDILDEELQALQEDEPKTCRDKIVKFLDSNPFQIALCLFILIDAGVVIAEILLDLHAIRDQFSEKNNELHQMVGFLRKNFAYELHYCDYHDSDPLTILDALDSYWLSLCQRNTSDIELANRTLKWPRYLDNNVTQLMNSDVIQRWTNQIPRPTSSSSRDDDTVTNSRSRVTPHQTRHNGGSNVWKLLSSSSPEASPNDALIIRIRRGIAGDSRNRQPTALKVSKSTTSSNDDDVIRVAETSLFSNAAAIEAGSSYSTSPSPPIIARSTAYSRTKAASSANHLLNIAHILHYCSIGILGVFVAQVALKIIAMRTEFFKKKLELFDGIIILTSFALDLAVEALHIAPGQDTAAILILFLLWRILRLINGIMVTAKKRQEFRIKLQKRARKMADKRIEAIEEERLYKEKEIVALRELCAMRGAAEDDILRCKPRRKSVHPRLGTTAGLSSIASLSLGLSMSMTAGVGVAGTPTIDLTAGASPSALLLGQHREKLANFMSPRPNTKFPGAKGKAAKLADMLFRSSQNNLHKIGLVGGSSLAQTPASMSTCTSATSSPTCVTSYPAYPSFTPVEADRIILEHHEEEEEEEEDAGEDADDEMPEPASHRSANVSSSLSLTDEEDGDESASLKHPTTPVTTSIKSNGSPRCFEGHNHIFVHATASSNHFPQPSNASVRSRTRKSRNRRSVNSNVNGRNSNTTRRRSLANATTPAVTSSHRDVKISMSTPHSDCSNTNNWRPINGDSMTSSVSVTGKANNHPLNHTDNSSYAQSILALGFQPSNSPIAKTLVAKRPSNCRSYISTISDNMEDDENSYDVISSSSSSDSLDFRLTSQHHYHRSITSQQRFFRSVAMDTRQDTFSVHSLSQELETTVTAV